MNGVCSCKTTPGTPASTIFKIFTFPKSPRECLQLVKVSSQSDKRCVLVYGTYTDTQTLIFIYIFNFYLQQLLKVTSQSMNDVCSCKATSGTPASRPTIFNFYFRATLGVKEVLQSSKNSASIFYDFWFYITPTV